MALDEVGAQPNISTPGRDKRDGYGGAEVVPLDRVFLRKAQAGDRDAFGELYRLHYGAIFRLARLHVPEAAEDVAAEVFVRAWQALPRYRDMGRPFLAWLYGIARHVISDERAKRRREVLSADPPERSYASSPVDRLVLAAAMERLPQEQRRVLEMKFLLGMKNPEVASVLGKSTGAINALQWRGLIALREVLGER